MDLVLLLLAYSSLTLSALAQQQSLSLNSSTSLNTSDLSASSFSLPQSSSNKIVLSIALCSPQTDKDSTLRTRFFATDNSALVDPGPNSAESDVYELIVKDNGLANLTLDGGQGGTFAVHASSASLGFQVGVSDTSRA